jgi:hypothetical protein
VRVDSIRSFRPTVNRSASRRSMNSRESRRAADRASRSAGWMPVFDGASWGPNNTIVFAQGGLFRVSASGSVPEKLAEPDATRGEANYVQPTMLPGGQAVLYTVILRGGQTRIVARRLRGDVSTVVEGGFARARLIRRRTRSRLVA